MRYPFLILTPHIIRIRSTSIYSTNSNNNYSKNYSNINRHGTQDPPIEIKIKAHFDPMTTKKNPQILAQNETSNKHQKSRTQEEKRGGEREEEEEAGMGEDLEAIDREKTAENALLEARSEHYHIVFFIHGDSTEREKAARDGEGERFLREL